MVAIERFSLGFDAAELGQRSCRIGCSLQRAKVVNVSRCARVTQFVGVVGAAIVESSGVRRRTRVGIAMF